MYKFSVRNIPIYYIISVNILYFGYYYLSQDHLFEGYYYINAFNYFSANVYGIVLLAFCRNLDFRKEYLYFLYFTGLVLAVKFIFLSVNNSYFAYSPGDSWDYHLLATNMAELSFEGSMNLLNSTYTPDDWGFPFVMYLLYSIVASPFVLTIFNIICVLLTFRMVRYMGRQFMSNEASDVAALIIGCSQYMIFFSATGLKEVLMVTIIIASFYYYFKYLRSQNNWFLFISIAIAVVLIFFRIPLVLFILIAIVFNQIRNSDAKFKNAALIVFVCFASAALWLVSDLIYRYIRLAQNVGELKASGFSYSSGFTYVVALISGFLGPLPTLVPIEENVNNAFYAGSLFLKVLISPFFLIGIYKIAKNKNKYLIPLLVFCICEIFSLTYILESFEFRKSLPHIPFVIMIAVYVIETLRVNRFSKAMIKYGSLAAMILLVLFWNLLRL